jgi:hypothetical protein
MANASDYMMAMVEAWVLKAIGHLPPEREAQIARLQPALSAAFGTQGAWDDSLAAALHFPPTLAASFQDLFQRYQGACLKAGQKPEPVVFARQIVEKNFATQIRAAIPEDEDA